MKPIIPLASLLCSFILVITLDPVHRDIKRMHKSKKGRALTLFESQFLNKIEQYKMTFVLPTHKRMYEEGAHTFKEHQSKIR